jgi:hypothetical protein
MAGSTSISPLSANVMTTLGGAAEDVSNGKDDRQKH